jgi:putative NADH-flavin reductase
MRILVFGASGGCGRLLVDLAGRRGHIVTAVVRPGSNGLPIGSAATRIGDPLDKAFVQACLRGQDAVVSCVGLRRAGKSPHARLLSPPDLTERLMSTIAEGFAEDPPGRIVAISAAGVGDSFERLSRPVKWLVTSGNVAVAYRDLANMERRLATLGTEWLAVRPVTLTNGRPSGRAREIGRYRLLSRIRRADVATFILDALESSAPLGDRAVMIGT